MQLIVRCPAKVNLTLDVKGVRSDGYHNIESIMQTISLYDYLTFSVSPAKKFSIVLRGNKPNIPYDEKNLVYKAINLVISENPKIPPSSIEVYLEKNIPTEAGLGGGSADAAGAIWAMNKIFKLVISKFNF